MRELVPDPDDRLVDSERLDRIQTGYGKRDYDGFIGLSPPNSFYVTGCYVGMYSRPVLDLVTDSTRAVGGPSIEARKAGRTAWTE
jgi:hypothetical protein